MPTLHQDKELPDVNHVGSHKRATRGMEGHYTRLNPRLTKPFYVTRLTGGGGVVTTAPVNLKMKLPR